MVRNHVDVNKRSAGWSDFFRYHGLWAPGVRLFRRLHFQAKALILSAMFVIPIALLSWQYFGDKQSMIDFTAGERDGVAALKDFVTVQHALVEVRAAQVAEADRMAGASDTLAQARSRTDQALQTMRQNLQDRQDPLSLGPQLDALISAWQTGKAGDNPEVRAAARKLLTQIGDDSGLVLDPDLDSFYLMKALVFNLPKALDDIGSIWAWGTHATLAAGLGEERERQWPTWEVGFQDSRDEVHTSFARSIQGNAGLKSKLDPEALKSAQALLQQGRQAVFGSGGVDTASFQQQGREAAAEVAALSHTLMPMLDDLLAQREARLQSAKWGTAVVLVLSLMVAWYLFMSFRKVLEGGLDEVAFHIDAMRDGDLTTDPRAWGQDEAARLMHTLKDMQTSLRHLVSDVRQAADTIVHASQEIASGSSDLAQRTSQSASELEQSASAMETVSSTVQQTAQSASQASALAQTNATAASRGGHIIGSVIDTMSEIQASSRQINEIVGTIDGIAFQTNILALNAAVEAARAGEQGRGFAVVASEVRALAQRTSTAAREVKRLIEDSVAKVEAGDVVVRQAGDSMQDIVAQAQRVNDLLAEIATGAHSQAKGVQQTALAVQNLDGATQQNAALVEETAASAESLRDQAHRLAQGVAVFKLN